LSAKSTPKVMARRSRGDRPVRSHVGPTPGRSGALAGES
jgi:hypothetical protein